MARSHEVRLTLGAGADAVQITQWDELDLTLDLMQPGNPWTVTLWRTGRGEAWARVREAAKLYMPVSVAIDGAVQVQGVLERIRDHADRSGAPFTIGGRDQLACALVADVDPRLSLRDSTLEEVFRRALGPLGIAVEVGATADEARAIQAGARGGARPATTRSHRHRVDRFKPRVGERVWTFLEALARRHGFLIYGVPWGDSMGVVIDRPAYDAAPAGALWRRQRPDGTWSGSLVSGTLDLDVTDVPTAVTVFGHGGLTAREDARHEATVENDRIPVRRTATAYPARPRYLHDPRARSPQIAEQRARREIARSMVNCVVYAATTQGWSQGSGAQERLWTLNTPVSLDDPITGARGNWLTTQVHFTRGRAGGHATKLRLVPPGALALEPDPET